MSIFDFFKYRVSGSDVIPIAILIPVICVILVIFFQRRKRALYFPPCTPDSMWANATRGGYISLPHKVEMTEWVCDHCPRMDISKGVTFRMSMPMLTNFFTTADWSLARLILAGDMTKNKEECDKTSVIKNINIFPEIDSILTAGTSNVAREKTRKFLAPAFSTANLQKTTMDVMRRKSLDYMELLNKKIDSAVAVGSDGGPSTNRNSQSTSKRSAEVDMKELNVNMIFEILTESLFDMKVGHKDNNDENQRKVDISDGTTVATSDLESFDCKAFLAAQNATMKESMVQARNPLRKYLPSSFSSTRAEALASREKLIQLGRFVIKKYRQSHPTVGSAPNNNSNSSNSSSNTAATTNDGQITADKSIIGHLMAHDYPSEEHRISDLLVFLIAGHETTAHSLSFFLYSMARNPEKCAKLQTELDEKVPANSFISPSDVSNLEYFGYCLKEAQRLYPVAPVVGRQLTSDIIHRGMLLPAGSTVAVHLWAMGRQRWIEHAESFIPERWSIENPQLESLKQMPTLFSMGKRSCIGQNLAMLEMRVLACMLLRNFSFTLIEEPEFELFITVKPVSLKMKITKRNESNGSGSN